jgi:hypothetical protein
MKIAAVAVSATELSSAVAFYELLGFRSRRSSPVPRTSTPRPASGRGSTTPGSWPKFTASAPGRATSPDFALLFGSPAEVDAATARVKAAGHAVGTPPYDAP